LPYFIFVVGLPQDTTRKNSTARFGISNTTSSFSFTVDGHVLWFKFEGVKPITKINEMLFNIPHRPKIASYCCPIVGNLLVNVSTNMGIGDFDLEYYDKEYHEWFFIDRGLYINGTNYTYLFAENLIPDLSYRFIAHLYPTGLLEVEYFCFPFFF